MGVKAARDALEITRGDVEHATRLLRNLYVLRGLPDPHASREAQRHILAAMESAGGTGVKLERTSE
jgi:hypothetical protein